MFLSQNQSLKQAANNRIDVFKEKYIKQVNAKIGGINSVERWIRLKPMLI
jgi:hypothetical protein